MVYEENVQFEIKQKNDRKGRNPQTGETITIEARRILSFKPSALLCTGSCENLPAIRGTRLKSDDLEVDRRLETELITSNAEVSRLLNEKGFNLNGDEPGGVQINLKTAVDRAYPVAGSIFSAGNGGEVLNNFPKAFWAISLILSAPPNCSAVRVSSLKNLASSYIAVCMTDAFA